MSAQVLPQHVDLQELGLKFDIPSGWTGQAKEEYIVLRHQSMPGIMILTVNDSKSAEALKTEAMKGIVQEGINLRPSGDFILKGDKRVEGIYEGMFDGTKVKCYAIGLINGLGHGMNTFILTEPQLFTDQHKHEANKLTASVKFYQAQDRPETTAWKGKLSGKLVKYLRTTSNSDYSGGYANSSSTHSMTLCSDGTCSMYSSEANSFNVGTGDLGSSIGHGAANSRESSEGTWIIYTDLEGTFLELAMNNDKVYTYKLKRNDKGHTLLNGTRYSVISSKDCN